MHCVARDCIELRDMTEVLLNLRVRLSQHFITHSSLINITNNTVKQQYLSFFFNTRMVVKSNNQLLFITVELRV